MILFTGGGEIARAYKHLYECEIVSIRHTSDVVLTEYLKKTTVVIHNAALIEGVDLDNFLKSNLIQTKRILDLVYSTNPNIRFVYLSSMSILKTGQDYLNSDDMSNYALSKYFAEIYCMNHNIKNKISVRFSTIFYGNYFKDGISKMIYDSFSGELVIINEGVAKRNIIVLEDAVHALYEVVQNNNLHGITNIIGEVLSFDAIGNIIKGLAPNLRIKNCNMVTKDVLYDFGGPNIFRSGTNLNSLNKSIREYYNTLKYLNENNNL